MAITSSFFNDIDGDRLYSAEDFADYFRKFIGNGVYEKHMNSMMVVATSTPSLTVEVKTGSCFINGYQAEIHGSPEKITLEDPSSKPRCDRIVARLDLNERKITVNAITGTPSQEPVAPDITRSGSVYDLGLAVIYVEANAENITDAQITDTRMYSDVCGFVTGVIEQIKMDDLFKQYQTAWELLVSGMELDEPNIIKAFEALNVTKSVNSVTPADGNITLSMDNIYSGKDYPKYTVQCGTISGAETTDENRFELNVVYPKLFKSKPTVVASFVHSNGDLEYANNPIVIKNETASGFTIRVSNVNRYNFNWIAVGDFVPEWEGAIPGTNLTHVEAGQMHSLTSDEIAKAFNYGGESNV